MRVSYRPELDGLRAVAVLAVFASHTGFGPAAGGWTGVGVFFVLSGYLITAILLAEHDRTGGIALGRFWVRRLLRLYPALLLVLVLGALAAPLLGGGEPRYLASASASGLYVQNLVVGLGGGTHPALVHLWSLAVEEQFYLVWPIVLVLVLRRGRSVLATALGGVAVSWALLMLTTGGPVGVLAPATYWLPHTRAGELLLGCALAARLARGGGAVLDRRWLAPCALAGLGLMALVPVEAGRGGWMPGQIVVTALLSAVLVGALVVRPEGPAGALLRHPLAVRLGVISYGFYLFHVPVLALTSRMPLPWAGKVLLALLLSLALSVLSHRFVERPFLRLKDRDVVAAGRHVSVPRQAARAVRAVPVRT